MRKFVTATEALQIIGAPYTFANVWSEVEEVFECRSWSELIDEIGDVLWTGTMWVHFKTGWELPVWDEAHLLKGLERQKVWRSIFEREGLEFSPRYLVGGSNYRRPAKVKAALALARAEA